jgi:hypothetical protein
MRDLSTAIAETTSHLIRHPNLLYPALLKTCLVAYYRAIIAKKLCVSGQSCRHHFRGDHRADTPSIGHPLLFIVSGSRWRRFTRGPVMRPSVCRRHLRAGLSAAMWLPLLTVERVKRERVRRAIRPRSALSPRLSVGCGSPPAERAADRWVYRGEVIRTTRLSSSAAFT